MALFLGEESLSSATPQAHPWETPVSCRLHCSCPQRCREVAKQCHPVLGCHKDISSNSSSRTTCTQIFLLQRNSPSFWPTGQIPFLRLIHSFGPLPREQLSCEQGGKRFGSSYIKAAHRSLQLTRAYWSPHSSAGSPRVGHLPAHPVWWQGLMCLLGPSICMHFHYINDALQSSPIQWGRVHPRPKQWSIFSLLTS